jgi:hypothetical protein
VSPHSPLPLPFALAPFAVGDALRAGVGAGRVRGADLHRPFWGVRAPTPPTDVAALARSYLERAHPSVFFSHVTAARLWGIRLPWRLMTDDTLDVGVPSPKRAQAARGIRGHKLRLGIGDLEMLGDIPVTSAPRTWFDIAPLLSDEELLAAGDSLLWESGPLTTPVALATGLSRHRGAAVRRIAPHLSSRADSAPESAFRWRFTLAGLPEAVANLQLFDTAGNRVARPDLAFPDFREAFDYEGDHHRTDPTQWQRDIQRVRRLEAIDWHLTRGAAGDLRDSRELIGQIAANLRAKGWKG